MDDSTTGSRALLARVLLASAAALPVVLAPVAAHATASSSAPAGEPASSGEPAPGCDLTWGSVPRSGSDAGPPGALEPDPGGVVDVRAGRHPCFDRLVVDLAEPGTEWWVQYVDQVTVDGSGDVVPTAGDARLQVVVAAEIVDVDPESAELHILYRPGDPADVVDVAGFDTFRQVPYAGGFEGQHTFGIGVRARLPFRVFHLDGPGDGSRLVVDVAHRWH